jgi:hypothetical protein
MIQPRKPVRLFFVFVVCAVLVSLGAPSLRSQAQTGTMASAPAATPDQAIFNPMTADSPLASPNLDARPVITRQEALGNSLAMQRQQVQAITVDKMGVQRPGNFAEPALRDSQQTTFLTSEMAPSAPRSLTGSPAPMLMGGESNLNPTSLLPNQTPGVDGCYSWLYNPTLDDAIGWYQFYPYAYIDYDAYYTYPNSIVMRERDDGDVYPDSGGDIDRFGQIFYFPSFSDGIDFNSLEVRFKTAELPFSSDDALYSVFYEVQADGNLGMMLGYSQSSLDGDGYWHSRRSYADAGAFMESLKGKVVALVFQAEGDGYYDAYDISVDDVVMKLCTTTSVPTGKIQGQITHTANSSDILQDALILLTYDSSADTLEPEVIDITFPDAYGNYAFETIMALPSQGEYQVWFLNAFDDDSRVIWWAGPSTLSFPDEYEYTWNVPVFDIGNVILTNPPNESEMVLSSSVTFAWNTRGQSGEQYYQCLYDEDPAVSYNTICAGPLDSGSLLVTENSFNQVPGFLQYGHRYSWYVVAVSSQGVGYSYYAQGITFLQTAPTTFTGPQPGGSAPSSAATREWLLMIYLAGDNNLGDPDRTSGKSSMIEHFDLLKRIAPSSSNIHVVTLSDFYDNSGTQLCYLSVSPPVCQQLGEKDTASPDTLSVFINTTIANFPHNRRVLVISDHGHGLTGLAVDETTKLATKSSDMDGYMMTPDELQAALQNANLNTAARKLSVLYLNTCLMGNLETAFSVKDFAQYMVASTNEVWVLDVYSRMLPLLTTGVTDRALATSLVNAYLQTVQDLAKGRSVSIAAFDLNQASSLRDEVSELGAILSNKRSAILDELKTIRQEVQLYDSSADEEIAREDAFVDIRHLAEILSNPQKMPDGQVRTQANAVLDVFNLFVIASEQRTGDNGHGIPHNLVNAHGLSIYFPDQNAGTQATLTHLIEGTNRLSSYKSQNAWVDFTLAYVRDVLGDPNTDPGNRSVASGPGNIQSGVLPLDGVLPTEMRKVYLPLVIR